MRDQAILLVGAAGFIGYHAARRLLQMGCRVVGIDSFTTAYDPTIKRHRWQDLNQYPGFEPIVGDVAEAEVLDGVAERFGPFSAVINLAARAGVRESLIDPLAYYQSNTIAALALLEFCKRHEIMKFILASTSSVYGEGAPIPTPEDAESSLPLQPYSASKKAAEVTAHAYYKHYGIDVSILRFFTVYGPVGRPDMSIFRFCRWISEGDTISVFGDGKQSRGFTYVSDVVDGVIGSLDLAGYNVINLGGHELITINDLITKISQKAGRNANIERHPALPAEISTSLADVSKAGKLLGWSPKISLDEGIAQTLAWYHQERSWASKLDLKL